jgi:hypothetical protein
MPKYFGNAGGSVAQDDGPSYFKCDMARVNEGDDGSYFANEMSLNAKYSVDAADTFGFKRGIADATVSQ